MAVKKFVLFLVEGLNDKREIETILHTPYFSSFRTNYKPYTIPINNDVTSEKLSYEGNIKERIGREVRKFRRDGVPFSNIRTSDIDKIIHVVDLDGAFIPRDHIIESDDIKFRYESDCIKTNNPDRAYGRNHKKATVLRVLVDTKMVDNIPYECYFVSCNMDHLISGNNNLQRVEKSNLARKFAAECNINPSIIFDAFFKEGIAYTKSYRESWETVQEGINSLERHTNFNLYLSSIINEEKCIP